MPTNPLSLACDLFSDDWQQGNQPRVEDYLSWVDDCDHAKLVSRLLQIEFTILRGRTGQAVSLQNYLERLPKFRRAVLKAWRRASRKIAQARQRTASQPEPDRIAAIEFTVLSGSQAGAKFVFAAGTSMQIGRSPESQLRFADDGKVSRNHAQLKIGLGGVRLQDLESRNGVRVNGKRVTTAVVQDGDIIRVGGTDLYVRLERG